MTSSVKHYVVFCIAIFVANLLIDLLDGADLNLRSVAKAFFTGLIAAAVLAWFEKRRANRNRQP